MMIIWRKSIEDSFQNAACSSVANAYSAWWKRSESTESTTCNSVGAITKSIAEAQAISRIHIVGQGKSAFIHRFMVSTISCATYSIQSMLGKKSQSIIDVR